MSASPIRLARRLGMLLFLIVLPLLVAAEGNGNDLDRNVRLLLRWKQDPEHYARLKRDYREFMLADPEYQARLRRLDGQLRALPIEEEGRLLRVMERYGAFVESLSEADRERLQNTQGKDRLALIIELRRQQWLQQLPYKLREELTALPENERNRELNRLAEEERRRRLLLTTERRRPFQAWRPDGKLDRPEPFPNRPTQLSLYPNEVVSFFEYHIQGRLTPEERKQLQEAEGQVAPLARVILTLAEKYPVLPPAGNKPPPLFWKELPVEWKKALPPVPRADKKIALRKELTPYEGRWPDFALAVVKAAIQEDRFKDLPPLGAARPQDYPPEVQPVFKKLKEPDARLLRALEGKWPDHPLKLHEVARKSNLSLPGMSLPGSKVAWDALLK